MTRLTNELRERIVCNAIAKSPVAARQEAHEKRRAAWVEKCRVESIGGAKEEARVLKALEKARKVLSEIPDELVSSVPHLKTDYEIYLNVAGCAYHGLFEMGSDGDRTRKPCVNGYKHSPFNITADNPLAVEFFEMEEERLHIEAMRESIEAQARAALYGCTTVKKLLEGWPEAVELLPKERAPVTAGLPSVNVQELNTLIGLPSE